MAKPFLQKIEGYAAPYSPLHALIDFGHTNFAPHALQHQHMLIVKQVIHPPRFLCLVPPKMLHDLPVLPYKHQFLQ